MKIGTYNVEHGHPVHKHVEMILRRFKEEHLGLLALTEMGDYVKALESAAKDQGHRLVFIDGPEARKSQALLVHRSHVGEIGRAWVIDFDETYYSTDGKLRHVSSILCVRIGDALYMVIHAPVGAWVPGKIGRIFSGPIRRLRAYRAFMKRLSKVFKTHHRPTCAIGDWNGTPDSRGLYSPNHVRRAAGGKFLRPHASTGHGEIDFAIVKGMHGSLSRRPARPEPSDHLLVTGSVSEG